MDANIADISDLATTHQSPHIDLHSVLSLDLHLWRSSIHPSVGALWFLDLTALNSMVVHGTTVDIVEVFISHHCSYLYGTNFYISMSDHAKLGSHNLSNIYVFPVELI
jgi:hypothetical protein